MIQVLRGVTYRLILALLFLIICSCSSSSKKNPPPMDREKIRATILDHKLNIRQCYTDNKDVEGQKETGKIVRSGISSEMEKSKKLMQKKHSILK